MPSLPNWLSGATASAPVPGSSLSTVAYQPRAKDPNAPDNRLQIATKCIYERELPGGSYITAHVERLQSGYYDSPGIHEDCIKNVRFLAIRFVFHEASTDRRFKSARIKVSVHDERNRPQGIPLPPQVDHPANHSPPPEAPREKPKFLRHAPHLLYGSISPETLDWNFNLAGSIGVSQAPVSASVNPSGGVKSSYKVYKMMKIQGSIRTNATWYGQHYDIEDGEIVWTMEENSLQKSGLPREFTFVMMLSKGDAANDVRFEIDVEPEIASWFGHFPQWWVHLLKYQPLHKNPLDLDQDIGQKFEPCPSSLGFNFAGLMSTFDDFVSLPGTTYGTHDPTGTTDAPQTAQAANPSSQQQQQQQQQQQKQQAPALTQSPTPIDGGNQGTPSNTLHLRIHLDPSQQRGTSLSASQAYPPFKSQRSPPPPSAAPTSSPKPATRRNDPKSSRRVTISGGLSTNTPKGRLLRDRPLSTHHEEQVAIQLNARSKAESDDDDFEYAFPESVKHDNKSASHSQTSFSRPHYNHHRPNKSTSTASSSIGFAPHPTLAAAAPPALVSPTTKTPLLSSHSLRRSQSRTGLRSASLHSEPESEEAISAAMDMLSGSPPPLAPAAAAPPIPSIPRPPASAPPPTRFPADDIVLATPRTRAALADLMEVERAEKARVERRNGHVAWNSEINNKPVRDVHADRAFVSRQLANRAEERERNRQKRYSMPVTSTGIGYSSTSGALSGHDSGSGNESGRGAARTVRSNVTGTIGGNGRSSLMISVGSKSDSGLGIGIGVATSTPGNADFIPGINKVNYTQPVRDGSAGVRAGDDLNR